ncbi:hypothetical protein BU24DRAFT_472237 [Aaosphaeria arxii CBS 175.79]|uniref:Uncharacterized protein n=1 Tax=Aaosphaeria arxii CBS 175.79 TaxID=1450172 RepID=A0A6A5XE77_9PLEO|nr:uncharacterized protein BU24DRAFT_472237 [Aaosphaeria arxii CBS 175.79]KAF2011097.1 hypothetical protein BU24DRAFT_472237 [Aaosphaeria arxii CBS 175.79]
MSSPNGTGQASASNLNPETTTSEPEQSWLLKEMREISEEFPEVKPFINTDENSDDSKPIIEFSADFKFKAELRKYDKEIRIVQRLMESIFQKRPQPTTLKIFFERCRRAGEPVFGITAIDRCSRKELISTKPWTFKYTEPNVKYAILDAFCSLAVEKRHQLEWE